MRNEPSFTRVIIEMLVTLVVVAFIVYACGRAATELDDDTFLWLLVVS